MFCLLQVMITESIGKHQGPSGQACRAVAEPCHSMHSSRMPRALFKCQMFPRELQICVCNAAGCSSTVAVWALKSKIPAGKFPIDPKIALPENDLNPGRSGNLPMDAPGAVVAAATIHGIRPAPKPVRSRSPLGSDPSPQPMGSDPATQQDPIPQKQQDPIPEAAC